MVQIFLLSLQHQTTNNNLKQVGATLQFRIKTMTKSIKIQQTVGGSKYFTIYEVRVEKYDGSVITYERFLNKKDAEEALEIVHELHSNLYKNAWIMDQMVWC